MPKTINETDHAQDIESFIASIDPKSMRDGAHLREIAAARQAVEEAETGCTQPAPPLAKPVTRGR